jgi:hypothetical protein
MKKWIWACATTATIFSACDKDKNEKPTDTIVVITGAGDITSKVNEFRTLLGNPLNTTTGQTTGRREINWDIVPAQFETESLPKDFFNPTDAGAPISLKRGFAYNSDGNFRVSSNGFGGEDPDFTPQMQAFSGSKTFANVSSFAWEPEFLVAGTAEKASVKGFGAVFSDVDIENNSSLEFFNGDKSLGKYFVPTHTSNSAFSFLGVYFKNDFVTKVKITHGNATILSNEKDITNGGTKDIVVLDDFLYDEPVKR